MNKSVVWFFVLAVALAAAIYFNVYFPRTAPVAPTADDFEPTVSNSSMISLSSFDPKNAAYPDIDDAPVTLVNGHSESPVAPGSIETVTTEYFGNEATGDLNGDGIPDRAFIVTQYGAGTGVFYYAVAAIQSRDGSAVVTNGVFIGDRIAPQSTRIEGSEIVLNYATRKPGEAMTETPTVGVTMHLKITATGKLTETEASTAR
jgi:hypothetical protein